ncbi:MAG: class A beta-lactamase [Verrucomicrobia bacterium]|nr:MAG: class A beta-lactamase [Verrucomicrobiota bacterium]
MAFGQNMAQDIEKIIKEKQASVGVAVIHNDGIFTIANDDKYPTMSVFKLHVAVTALKKMENENIPLDTKAYIEQKEMLKHTYSPLRDKYPDQGIRISYRDIIDYTVKISDNNTCDWLIRFVGGINKVNSYIKSIGIKEMNFTETEESMHTDIMRCYNNWSTPLAVAQLLKKIYAENLLAKEHFTFLETSMLNCVSGKNKLIAGLPHDIKFGHKTGHSDRTADGIQISEADAGVIYLPNGEKCYIVVLIKDSRESDDDNAKIMADISNAVYRYLRK